MSVNAIQFMYAALANGDTTRYNKGHNFDSEGKRLRELVPLYPAWKVTELMQARRAA